MSLAFIHIPPPEFGDDERLALRSGHGREPTEGPSLNTHFYDALAREGVAALGCGHDHVNDFCALWKRTQQREGGGCVRAGPWLCYAGGSGFRGYCSYGRRRFHRGARLWELDGEGLRTWRRVEYAVDRVDELVLVERGAVV
jgi:hypothetical protein